MATRTNLAIDPFLKNVSPPIASWFGPSGWARTTSVHASLPRTIGFAGSTAGDIAASRGAVTAGKYVVVSASVRFTSPSTCRMNIDWFTTGGTYISTTVSPLNDVAGSTTLRIVSGVGLAPVGAARAQPNIAGIDGSAEVTAVLIEAYDTEGAATAVLDDHALDSYYFDGDTAGAVWNGVNGESTSTLTFSEPMVLSAALAGPSVQIVGQRIVPATLTAALPSPLAAIGLFVTVAYDERRGRIRIDASGFAVNVVRVVVSFRIGGRGRYTQVRGGKVAVAAGELVRTVDHYEFTPGESVEYLIQALSTQEGQTDQVVQTRTVLVGPTEPQVWVKFIAAPYLNRRVELIDWSEVARRGRVALYDVSGRRDRVAVTDVHTGREMTVQVVTHTLADRDTLDDALGTGAPVFFQTPTTVACPTMYAAVGDFSWRRPTARSLRSLFSIQLFEVAAPPPSVVGVGLTYTVLAGQFATYVDIADEHVTYTDVAG